MTFSFVAKDGDAFGIAVASKFLAAAALVPWCRAGTGAIATQAFANLSYGTAGLELLARGADAASTAAALTEPDEMRSQRQIGIVDARGGAFSFTGSDCTDWAGGRCGDGYAAQGNILTGPGVIDALCDTFENATGTLADRLARALHAGDRAGGDRRGRQSAGVVVVSPAGGYGGTTDIVVDLRVDDHPDPCTELLRLLELHHRYFDKPSPEDLITVDAALLAEIRERLTRIGHVVGDGDGYDPTTRSALERFAGWENLEERVVPGDMLDRHILDALRARS